MSSPLPNPESSPPHAPASPVAEQAEQGEEQVIELRRKDGELVEQQEELGEERIRKRFRDGSLNTGFTAASAPNPLTDRNATAWTVHPINRARRDQQPTSAPFVFIQQPLSGRLGQLINEYNSSQPAPSEQGASLAQRISPPLPSAPNSARPALADRISAPASGTTSIPLADRLSPPVSSPPKLRPLIDRILNPPSPLKTSTISRTAAPAPVPDTQAITSLAQSLDRALSSFAQASGTVYAFANTVENFSNRITAAAQQPAVSAQPSSSSSSAVAPTSSSSTPSTTAAGPSSPGPARPASSRTLGRRRRRRDGKQARKESEK